MIQPALPFDWPADEADDDFLITPSNAGAVKHLEAVGTWPVAASLLVGPRKSGRSTLGRLFARRTGGRFIDDADRRPDKELFDAWNLAQETKRPVLLVAEAAPPAWHIDLPDLASRIGATPIARIGEPDEALVGRLFARLLERRGLFIGQGTLAYLATRVPRSHRAVIAMADALDALSLAERRAVTIPLARAALGNAAIDERDEED